MDIVDECFVEQESELEYFIKKASVTTNRLKPKGECYACDESIEHPKLFCNSECADEHAKMEKIKSQRLTR